MLNLNVVVTGGEPRQPDVIRCKGHVSKELCKRLPKLSADEPILIHAQVGSGKTYAIVHDLLPWAISTNRRILYASSRVANNTQIKMEIVKVTGELDVLKEHTPYGLAKRRDFKGVSVVTYHTLYSMMLYQPGELHAFDILVFDEIQALLEDSLFVPYTGYILRHIKDHFGAKFRIYMSATPDEILPLLVKAETPYRMTVLKFSRDFSHVKLHFFRNEEELVRCIGEGKNNGKWLIYTPSIGRGEKLREQLACNCRMLNSVTREEEPTSWDELLDNRVFKEKVAIATAVVDVGVSFEDRELRNVAVFSVNLVTLIQFLGRKRCKDGECVNLYVYCPTEQELMRKIRDGKRLLAQLGLYHSNRSAFMEHHILHPGRDDLRRFVRCGWGGEVYLNDLAKVKIENELTFLEKMLQKRRNDEAGFERYVMRRLGLKDVKISDRYLGVKPKTELDAFLERMAGKEMTAPEFSAFAAEFRDLCVKAYGTGKGGRDRKDRCWHEDKISKKLSELESRYELYVDRVSGVHMLRDTGLDKLVLSEVEEVSSDGR